MQNTKTTQRKKGGAFLLIISGVFFASQFTNLDTYNSILGMVASVFIISIALYSVYKTSKNND